MFFNELEEGVRVGLDLQSRLLHRDFEPVGARCMRINQDIGVDQIQTDTANKVVGVGLEPAVNALAEELEVGIGVVHGGRLSEARYTE